MKHNKPTYVINAIRTPDGTVLRSSYRHDFKSHLDANGEEYMVDGGLDYLRRNDNREPFVELSVLSSEPFETIRAAMVWGTYGKGGKGKLNWIKLCEMSNDHIDNVIKHLGSHIEAKQKAIKNGMNLLDRVVAEVRDLLGRPPAIIAQVRSDAWTLPYFEEERRFRKAHNIHIADPSPTPVSIA